MKRKVRATCSRQITHINKHVCTLSITHQITASSTLCFPLPSSLNYRHIELKAEAEHQLKLKKAEVEALHDGFVEKERILKEGAEKRVRDRVKVMGYG